MSRACHRVRSFLRQGFVSPSKRRERILTCAPFTTILAWTALWLFCPDATRRLRVNIRTEVPDAAALRNERPSREIDSIVRVMSNPCDHGATNRFWLRQTHLLFGGLGVMLAYVLYHDESFLAHPKDPIWLHYKPFKWWLLPHGLGGACAILLGSLQFSEQCRQRYQKLHRVLGRIYVVGVFVAAPLGVYSQCFEERLGDSRSFTVAAVVNVILLIGTTTVALVFVRKGRVQPHRQWMTR